MGGDEEFDAGRGMIDVSGGRDVDDDNRAVGACPK
jgi:hypothetical protein